MSEIGRETLAAIENRPVKRLVVPIIGIALGFCAACAWALAESHKSTWERAADMGASLVTAIERDVSRNVETIDLSLQAVVDNLKLPEVERMNPEMRNLLLFDRSATARHLGAILVTDADGNIRYD